MSNAAIDFVLCIGFGGPTSACCKRRCENESECPFESRAACFVSGILGDNPARQKRVDEVSEHYTHFEGVSPYNKLTEEQTDALEQSLAAAGTALPVFVAYRHWAPWTVDVLRKIAAQGLRNGVLLILAPHQSSVSWDWYIKTVDEAEEALQQELGDAAPRIVEIAEPWWTDTGYIDAMSASISSSCADWSAQRKEKAAFIYTAHAIPKAIEDTSPYRQQFQESAALSAKQLGLDRHYTAFQSQPGDSSIPWSGPDICALIKTLHEEGVKDIVVHAAGFLVDHIEVLYDLDYEAKELAEGLGMNFHRAPCVHAQPQFIDALRDRVTHAINIATNA